ncbi:hypothetical protein [Clostridium sp. JNZ J1-5]
MEKVSKEIVKSIKLKINDNLVEYITNQSEVSIENAPSIFVLRKIGLPTINFDIAI